MWLYYSLVESETKSLLVKEQGQKELEKRFLGLSPDTHGGCEGVSKFFQGDT